MKWARKRATRRSGKRSVARKLLKRMAPQPGFEPGTLRLTASRRCPGSGVLRADSSDQNPVSPGVRQRIVQRLFSAVQMRACNAATCSCGLPQAELAQPHQKREMQNDDARNPDGAATLGFERVRFHRRRRRERHSSASATRTVSDWDESAYRCIGEVTASISGWCPARDTSGSSFQPFRISSSGDASWWLPSIVVLFSFQQTSCRQDGSSVGS
jgi:hypothetical protein